MRKCTDILRWWLGGTAIFLFIILFIYQSRSAVSVRAVIENGRQLISHQCGSWYLSGVNVPWQNGGYGADFGTVEEWSQHTYDAATTAAMFADLQTAGMNSVRWWIFTDGRGAPEFDANAGGNVTGLDAAFLPSMKSAIQLAAAYDIYVVFVLWDFAMVFPDSTQFDRGDHGGGHHNLITSDAARQTFIDNALLPMLQYPVGDYTIGTHPHVLGWEIINEPEWVISDLGAVDGRVVQSVSLAQMHQFVAELSAAIHQNSSQMVTVGSTSLKWNSDTVLGAEGNFWSDAKLAPYAVDGTLDFYQVHYYGWMNGDEVDWSFSPLFNSFADAELDKPTIIGEFPADAQDTGVSIAALLNGIYDNGYSGAWSWTYADVDEHGGWADSQAAYAAFNLAHANEVAMTNRCEFATFLPALFRQ